MLLQMFSDTSTSACLSCLSARLLQFWQPKLSHCLGCPYCMCKSEHLPCNCHFHSSVVTAIATRECATMTEEHRRLGSGLVCMQVFITIECDCLRSLHCWPKAAWLGQPGVSTISTPGGCKIIAGIEPVAGCRGRSGVADGFRLPAASMGRGMLPPSLPLPHFHSSPSANQRGLYFAI